MQLERPKARLQLSSVMHLILLLLTVLFIILNKRIHFHMPQHIVPCDRHDRAIACVDSLRFSAPHSLIAALHGADESHNSHKWLTKSYIDGIVGDSSGRQQSDTYLKKNNGLSACLLVNDENPRLSEWIAYHYEMLPLRSLIVAVDPGSRTSPASILDRWKQLMGLDIQLWEEADYLPHMNKIGRIEHGACNASDPNVSDNLSGM